MFEPAGSDQDLRDAYDAATIESALKRGEELLASAAGAVARGELSAGEPLARDALAEFVTALNWADDGPQEPVVHKRLDRAGRWVRETFGCEVHQEGTQYFMTCPVRLAHHRVGFSIGGRARRLCSLCGDDISECPHHRRTAYIVPGGITDLAWCRVCLSHDGCDHRPEERYRVSVVAIVTDLVIDEVSLVDRPANPGARILKRSIETVDLQAALGPRWTPGIPVSCDFCLTDCGGLTRLDPAGGE